MSDTTVGMAIQERPRLLVRIKYMFLDIVRFFRKREPSQMLLRAKKELELAGLFDKGTDSLYDGMIADAVMELMKTFSGQGHSGMSANITSDIFHQLVRGDVLSPLTGKPDEWVDQRRYGDNLGTSFQNKRNSAVFAEDEDGKGAYYLTGRVFVDKNGASFTTGAKDDPLREKGSSVLLTFPCTPKTVYIHEGTPEAEPFSHVFKEYNDAE